MAAEIAEIVAIGERLNYEGEQLSSFVKEQQDRIRDERAARRAEEKENADRISMEKKAQLEIEFYKIQAEKEEKKLIMELKLEEAKRVPIPSTEGETSGSSRNSNGFETWATKLIPKFVETDVSNFFLSFEKVAKQMSWERKIWPLLIQSAFVGRAQVVYASLSEEDSKSYDIVKGAVLDAYELVPEIHRLKFRRFQRNVKQSYWEFARHKEMLLDEWLRSTKVNEFAELRELLLVEDFKDNLPTDIRRHIEEFELDTLEKAAKAADHFEVTHKSNMRSYAVRNYNRSPQFKRYEYYYKPWNEGKSNSKFNVRCYNCDKIGHIQRECKQEKQDKQEKQGKQKQGKVAFTVKKDKTVQKKFSGRLSVKDIELYGDFITEGKLKGDSKDQEFRTINALRDTGASHSCVLKSIVPKHKLESTKEYIILGGFPNSVATYPVVEMYLDIGYIQTPVKLAVVETLPIEGVDILVGNETARNKSSNTDIIQINLVSKGNLMAVTRSKREKKNEQDVDEVVQESNIEEVKEIGTSIWNRKNFIKEQASDRSLQKMRDEIDEDQAEDLSKPKFVIKEEILYRKVRSKHAQQTNNEDVVWQIVVPGSCRSKIVMEAHENQWSGHFGIDKTYHQIVKHFWWPKVKQDVKKIISACHVCQVVGKPNVIIPKSPLQPVKVTGNPFSHLVIDIVGPLPRTSSRNEYMLSIIDRVTRYPEAIPIKRVSSKIIIDHLILYFSHFGFPQSIQTDRGTCFTSKEFTTQLKEWNITHKLSTPYHPESQGVVERLHQTLKNSLTKYCHNDVNNWDKQLPFVLFALRSVHNVSLGFSPFQLIYGHEVNGPLEVIRSKLVGTTEEGSIEQLKLNKERLKKMKDWSLENLEESQTQMKERFDKRSKKREFQVGDKVLVLLPSPGQFKVKYSGPGIVKRKINDLNYEVNLPGRRRVSQIFHINLLKLYQKSSNEIIQVITVDEPVRQLEEDWNVLQVSDKADYQWLKLNKETRNVLGDKLNHLDGQKQDEMFKLCNSYNELFSEKLGNVTGTRHEVKLKPETIPIRQAPYKLNPTKTEEVRTQVEYMLQNNLIEHSKSPWSSPVVLVPKKEGGYRLCVDYRKVNEQTIPDCFPLPRIEDCVERIGEAKYVSKVDLLKGYWQIPLAPEAKEVSAFITPDGLYQCTRMPFGMKNAAGTFQRLMSEVTKPLTNCVVYLDDIVLFNDDWHSHLENIEKLFQQLRKSNLVINLSKCEFAHAEIVYLGHKVGGGKIAPKDSNIQAIVNFPIPSNRKQVRQFLGLCGYYRKYVRNFSDLAYPLTELLKKENKFHITPEVIKAVNQLKTILSSSPILKTPNWKKPFEIYIDASNVGLGAVLCQEDDKIKHPIAFFSKKLNKHQKNYSTVEKECLALVSALQHFELYITNGNSTTHIYSDHNPLVYINRFKNKNRRLMSWSWIIQEFNIQMHHVKGKENTIADALSRIHQE